MMENVRGNHGRFTSRRCEENELAGEDQPRKFSKAYEQEQDRLAKENHEAFEICTAYPKLSVPSDLAEREIYLRRREQKRCPKCGAGNLDFYQGCSFSVSVEGFLQEGAGYCNKCRIQWCTYDEPPQWSYKEWYRPRAEDQAIIFDKREDASQCPKCGVQLYDMRNEDERLIKLRDNGDVHLGLGYCHKCKVKFKMNVPEPKKSGKK